MRTMRCFTCVRKFTLSWVELIISQLPLSTTTSSSTVDIVSTANDLGVILDGQLTMATHVSSVCRAGFFPATSVAVSSPISDDRGDTCLSPGLLVVVSTTATLFWQGSLMFIFSDSSFCKTRQPVWSPGLVGTTTSRRFLLAYTGFHYASESATSWRCLCGSVYTMQPLATWLTCVCRLTPCVVASNCVPGVWDSAGPACPDCYWSAQLRHQWTTNMEQSASRS